MSRGLRIGQPSGYPSWRQGLPINQWSTLSGTAAYLVNLTNFPWPDPNWSSDQGGMLSGWQSVVEIDGVCYTFAASGHGSWQNQCTYIDLNTSPGMPEWNLFAPVTPTTRDGHCSVFTNVALPNVDNVIPNSSHYHDGRPTGRHAYYTPCGVRASKSFDGNPYGVLPTLYKGGAFQQQGGYDYADYDETAQVPTIDNYNKSSHVDGFNLNTRIWDVIDTWEQVSNAQFGNGDPNFRSFFDWSTCVWQHPTTDDIYLRRGSLQKYAVIDVSAGRTWAYHATTAAVGGSGGDLSVWDGCPTMIDANRNRVVCATRRGGMVDNMDVTNSTDNFTLEFINLADDTTSYLPVTGITIPTWLNSLGQTRYGPNGAGLVHDTDNDRYLFMQKYAYDESQTSPTATAKLYTINPTTGAASLLNTTQGPWAQDDVLRKFRFVPSLHGCVWFPTFWQDIRFFPTA